MKSSKASNPHLVVKSNELINARMNGFSAAQIRLFEMLIAQLERDQDKFHSQRIYLRDFVEGVGTKHKGEFDRAREVTKSLMSHVIEIWDGDKLRQRNILHSADYDKKKPYVEIVFHPDLRPYLLQLKERFTTYDVRNILVLKRVYSMRMYQLMKQYLFIGKKTFLVEELKRILGLEGKYKKYGDFKKYAIQAAQRELREKCDITFDFEEIKKGRKVEFIRFFIRRQEQRFGLKGKDEESQPIDKKKEKVIFQLRQMGIVEDQARGYVEQYSPDRILELITYTQKQYERKKIKASVAAYLIKLIESEAEVVSEYERAQQLPKSKQQKAQEVAEIVKLRITQLEREFAGLREQEVDDLLVASEEKDWEMYKEWIKENPYIMRKVMKQGEINRKDLETISYFRTFLETRLPDRREATIAWAEREKGIKLTVKGGHLVMVQDA